MLDSEDASASPADAEEPSSLDKLNKGDKANRTSDRGKGPAVVPGPSNQVSANNFLSETVSAGNCNEQHPEQIAGAHRIAEVIKDYELAAKVLLGRGAFSHVYQGVHRTTADLVAVKAIKCSIENPSGYYSEYKMNRVLRDHPNVVQLLDNSPPQDAGDGYLIFELCDRGEVFRQIVPNVGLSPRDRIGAYFAQLVEAVAHVHDCGVCHMDIKPENLFITATGRVKLGDFGLSVLMEDGPVVGRRGSVSYAAPENLRSKRPSATIGEYGCGNQARASYDGERADMWSVGVTLFVFLYGFTPWEAAHDNSYEFRCFKMKDGMPTVRPWNRMPTVFRTIFHRTVSLRPARRWSCAQLKEYINRDLGWHGS